MGFPSKSVMPPPGEKKPGLAIAIGVDPKAGKPPEAPQGADDGTSMMAHDNLDELMSGDPKVAKAISGLLAALCEEEGAEGEDGGEGEYGSAEDIGNAPPAGMPR